MALDARKVLIPLGVLMVVLVGLFFLFEESYSHINNVGLHISRIQDRQRLLAQIVRTVNEAESAQRGYLLSGDASYLQIYADVRSRTAGYLKSLEDSYREDGVEAGRAVQSLGTLTTDRLAQIDLTLETANASGREAAVQSALTGAGVATMNRFRGALREREAQEADDLVAAWERYLIDLHNTRLAMAGATLLNLLLLAFVGYLLWRALRSRMRETEYLQEEIDQRAKELASLSSYLQQVSEREKQQLARELHDSLGGLLVATKMDLAWLRARLPTRDEDLLLRWRRIQQSLDQGVDLKRRVVEQLRPTLLDNMGLFAALRWQVQETCGRAGLKCAYELPEAESRLTSEASIALFRVAQESMTNILKHSRATKMELSVRLDDERLTMVISDNGRGIEGRSGGGQGMAGMRHRVHALGGKITIGPREEGGTEVNVQVPLHAIVSIETMSSALEG